MAATPVVDWSAAGAAAAALAPPGPKLTPDEMADLVAELRGSARRARGPVATTARLDEAAPAGGSPARGAEDRAVLVVDRAGWARANATSFGALVDPVLADALARQQRRREAAESPGSLGEGAAAVSRLVNAAETGSLLAFLATKVLGQYDVLAPGGGRLLLVAPNIASVEAEIGAVPADFRLWVCLHEETHRLQFAAAGWLADWFTAEVRSLVADLLADPATTLQRLLDGLAQLPEVLRAAGQPVADDQRAGAGLIDLVQTPEQRARLDELTAVMSLLEGHADVVMDEVGPSVVPSVAQIRARFDARRRGRGPVDRAVRRLLGLEAKAAQYRNGAAFVRGVTDRVGVDGFNAVWSSPAALPSAAELGDPAAWVARVHG